MIDSLLSLISVEETEVSEESAPASVNGGAESFSALEVLPAPVTLEEDCLEEDSSEDNDDVVEIDEEVSLSESEVLVGVSFSVITKVRGRGE